MTASRRSFIKFAVFLPSSFYLAQCKTVGRSVGSSSYLKVSPVNSYLPKRVSWDDLSVADRTAFVEAIKTMKRTEMDIPAEFGEGGPRKLDKWLAQAECHEWYCPHGTWDFLPWHRAYLYHFELYLRKEIRDSFRLPYWDWSKNQEIPQELQDLELLSVLKISRDSTRISFPGEPGEFQTAEWWKIAFEDIARGANYDSIGGDLESDGSIESPYHNMVHVGVGGDMSAVAYAARDPIFWLHHCNVDRLWSLWMENHIANAESKEDETEKIKEIHKMFPAQDVAGWLATSFPNNFWKPDGTLASATTRSSLFTEEMGYNYDTSKKTWDLTDIPPDQPVAETSVPVEKVENSSPGLRLADPNATVLALSFTLPAAIFNGPQKLLSLRLKLAGIPEPQEKGMRYAVSLITQGKTLPLPEIVFFQGSHASHKKSLIGVNLNKHINALVALPEGKRTVQLILVLKNKQGQQQSIPNLQSDSSRYKVKVKAVFS